MTTIPYIRMNQIKKFITEMPKESCNIDELINKFGRSNVGNALPTLTLLKLVKYDKKEKKVSLSEAGRRFRAALMTEHYKKAREILKNIIDEIDLFKFIRGLLDRKGSISNEEIGKELAFKYNKTWRNPITYRTHGSACASILGFAGYGICERGILRKGEYPLKKDKKLPSPYLSFGKMLKILREIGNEEADLHSLSSRLNTKENRLGAELSVCVELGIIERLSPGKFILTTKGNKLIDPLNEHSRKDIWREILLGSSYSKIVSLLKDRSFSFQELGRILKHHFGGKWREDTTINAFAKKFLNWLKEAEIIESEGGKYRLKAIGIKTREQNNSKVPQRIISTDYYAIGKRVGIISVSKSSDEIKKAVSDLINICKNEDNLNDVIELMNEHLKLFMDMRLPDGRIFLPDIKLLERILGAENGV